MSRQNKQARLKKLAITFKGSKGPAKTTPKHGKKKENRSKWNRGDRLEGRVAAPAEPVAVA